MAYLLGGLGDQIRGPHSGDQTSFGDRTWDHIWGPHLGTTLGDRTWRPHLGTILGGPNLRDQILGEHSGTKFGGPNLGDHTWGPHVGDHIWTHVWGPRPRLGTTLRPSLIALFLKLCIVDIMKYFLMLWRAF